MRKILKLLALFGIGMATGTLIAQTTTSTPPASQIAPQPPERSLNLNQGTSAVPATGLSFVNPTHAITVWDNSPQTSDVASQSNPYYAPALSVQTNESGGATAVPLYTQANCLFGSTGTCAEHYLYGRQSRNVFANEGNFKLKAKSAFRAAVFSADFNAGNGSDTNSNDSLSSNWDYYQAQEFQVIGHSWSVRQRREPTGNFSTILRWLHSFFLEVSFFR